MSLDPRAIEMVTTAHKRQLALRFEVSALTAAVAAGHTTTVGQQAYALTWLAEYAAERIMALSEAVGEEPRAPRPVPQTHCECTHPQAYANDAGRCFKCGWALRGHKAEQQHGTAVPTKAAAGKGGTPGRAPIAQSPQGAAGTPIPPPMWQDKP